MNDICLEVKTLDEIDAAIAYDNKVFELNGANCYFNFPERLQNVKTEG